MAKDPELIAHLEWLGYIQPVGLVVSPPALVQAQAHINRNIIPQHQRFLSCLQIDKDDQAVPQIDDFSKFVREVFDWRDSDLIEFNKANQSGLDVSGLEVVLPEYNETLRPTWVVPEYQSPNAAPVTTAPSDSPPTQKRPGGAAKSLYADDPEAALTAKLESATELVSEDRNVVTYSENVTQSTDDELSVQSGASQPSNASRFVMLIQQVANDQDLDEPLAESDRRWHASPHARFERLLRETQVPAGLLTNGRNLRLVYAPRGETSGYLTFNVDEMTTVAGRPIFAAFHMLLNSDRLFNLEKKQRLPAVLAESRKYQNTVSTQLAQQVMAALYEFLRGFQSADDQWNGRLLKDVLAHDPQHVYHGLLTVLMRTVFVLYAEDRNLLSNHPVYTNYYAITGLFERLRADAGQYPDTMDQRYGAWAQLLTLFRMIYEGGNHDELRIPPRKGYLFDPKRYPFLEGVGPASSSVEVAAFPTAIPRVSDGVIYRVLNNLLILDGERLSYRSLDVEQIGSVYEAIMGFEVEVSTGRSIAIKPVKKHGAPATINLEELLKSDKSKRAAWLKERSDQDVTGKSLELLKSAGTIEDLLAALESKIANEVTPNVVPAGAMIFQPSDERRRSGSHYTPRSLTEPIVRTTLEPILKQLVTPFSPDSGEKVAVRPDEGARDALNTAEPLVWQPTPADKKRFTGAEIAERIRLSKIAVENARQAREVGTPHPSQILDLKICDPAMGSGAFLVETCRQLGDELIKSWYAHDLVPKDIPPDEDEVLYARRLIAQRCLYGVDKNIMAVDLAKLSLWLVTLAKEHPFTFLDHSLRHGDSLVGLTRQQIIGFHWEPGKQKKFGEDLIQKRLDRATEARAKILNAREDVPYRDQEQRLAVADEALNVVRLTGDACVSAFFAGSKPKERERRCNELFQQVSDWYASGFDISKRSLIAAGVASLRSGEHPLPPFHWEIEFPEIFLRENPGFDAFVANPPFLGGKDIAKLLDDVFVDCIKTIVSANKGSLDLAAYFLHRMSQLTRDNGAFGLIATMALVKGGTRQGGLADLIENGFDITSATSPREWPGAAAVHFITIVIAKGSMRGPAQLDGNVVACINSHLKARKEPKTPAVLKPAMVWSRGTTFLGEGFMLSPAERDHIVSVDPASSGVIRKLMGGTDLVQNPAGTPTRYVIDFGEMPEEDAKRFRSAYARIVETVKPQRDPLTRQIHEECFWKHWDKRDDLYAAVKSLPRVLAFSMVTKYVVYGVVEEPAEIVFSDRLGVLANPTLSLFAIMQSRVNDCWTVEHSNRRGETLQISIRASLGTFPFPCDFEQAHNLEMAGDNYVTFRNDILATRKEGLTDIYNRFHEEHENSPDIKKLRELHAAMDRAVLEAYGWHDLAQTARCEFLLDYEEEDDDKGGSAGASPSRRKKPWRLRWPDDFRDEVLARLLELNEQRHEEELLAGKGVSSGKRPSHDDDSDTDEDEDTLKPKKAAKKTRSPKKTKKSPASGQQEMEF